mgnify:CR=1 FL=1
MRGYSISKDDYQKRLRRIEGQVRVRIGGVPLAFWELRRQMIRYPLGFDAFFVHRGRVVGFPRTTQAEVA